MDIFGMLILFAFTALGRLARRVLPLFVAAVGGIVFLPMVALGAAGILTWRSLEVRRRRWLVLLSLMAAVAYVAGGRLLGADPLLLYLMVQLSLLGAVALWLLGQPADALWQPVTYVAALPAIGPGAVVAALLMLHWPHLWSRRRAAGLATVEPQGLTIPPRTAALARLGIAPPPGGWGVGYRKEGVPVGVDDFEARHHVLVCGTPGSGKTTVLQLLLEGVSGRCPVVVVDCKGSGLLREAVAAIPGSVVWTIGGNVRWDALRGDPSSFAEKLLAAEVFSPQAEIYRASAARYVQWIGRLLALEGLERDPHLVLDLLKPVALRRHIRRLRSRLGPATPPFVEQIAEAVASLGPAELSGVSGFAARFGLLLEGTLGASLGAGSGTLVLEEAIRASRTVLFSLDAARYRHIAAKVGAWVLLDLVAVAAELQSEAWGQSHQVYVVVDEFSGLKEEGQHVVPVLARGREAGFACVIATQGLADLDRVGPGVTQQVMQNTAVKIVLRQGSTRDAEEWAKHLGRYQREAVSRLVDDRGRSLGRHQARWQSEPNVAADHLRLFGTGDAVVAVAPLGEQPARLERVRVARPVIRREEPRS
jgi:hypothetical protein